MHHQINGFIDDLIDDFLCSASIISLATETVNVNVDNKNFGISKQEQLHTLNAGRHSKIATKFL